MIASTAKSLWERIVTSILEGELDTSTDTIPDPFEAVTIEETSWSTGILKLASPSDSGAGIEPTARQDSPR